MEDNNQQQITDTRRIALVALNTMHYYAYRIRNKQQQKIFTVCPSMKARDAYFGARFFLSAHETNLNGYSRMTTTTQKIHCKNGYIIFHGSNVASFVTMADNGTTPKVEQPRRPAPL